MQSGALKYFLCTIFSLAIGLPVFGQAANRANELSEDQRLHIAVEALSRLQDVDREKNPQIKATIDRILAQTRGTPQFVQLVKQLKLKDQNPGLLEMAKSSPGGESGVEAARLLMTSDTAFLKKALMGDDALKITEALGNTGMKEAVSLLVPIVTNGERDLVLRKTALHSAVQTSEGAEKILELARKEELSADLKLAAGMELSRVRWEKIKTEAATLLPVPQGRDSTPLPGIAELSKMKGDIARGDQVFFRTETACGTCHKVGERGMDIGPALTEIGTKLGKDALFESILDPNAGISFGFEATQVDLKSGDEAYGLVVSDTEDEVVMKDLKGIVSRHKKGEIASRRQLKTSLMPADLQKTMSAQELVDLVEFLSAQRKAD